MTDIYTEYYLAQAGSGIGDFYGGPIYQRGTGVGRFLGGLIRRILPLLKRGALAAGKEFLRAGANVVEDIQLNKPPQQSVRARVKEAVNHLTHQTIQTMRGNGYKGKRRLLRGHSNKSRETPRVRAAKNKKKSKIVKKKKKKAGRKSKANKSKYIDIFST